MDNSSIAKELLVAMKQANKRLFIIVLVLVVALVATNVYWIWDSSQWEYETTYEVDTQNNGGSAVIQTGNGEVKLNGESESDAKEEEKKKEKNVIDSSND